MNVRLFGQSLPRTPRSHLNPTGVVAGGRLAAPPPLPLTLGPPLLRSRSPMPKRDDKTPVPVPPDLVKKSQELIDDLGAKFFELQKTMAKIKAHQEQEETDRK